MIKRTTKCSACGNTFHVGVRGPVASRCDGCKTKSYERALTCTWCGGAFIQIGRGRPASSCSECRKRCNVDGCTRPPVRTTGLCGAHYKRAGKGADLAAPIRQWETGDRRCKVEGCDGRRIVRSATYCASHYQEHVYQRYAWAWRYGMTPEKFAELLAVQGGRCAICGTGDPKGGNRTSAWTIDHDHACCPGTKSCGKCIRGLLCGPCNRGIGQFGDDPAVVEAAAAYLRRYTKARMSSA